MLTFLSIWIFLWISFHQTLSIKIGKINYSSLNSRSPIYRSSNINCTDCYCNCFNPLSSSSSSCLGINCFPSNYSCQLIEPQRWILQSDIITNKTSNNFLAIKQNISRLCSCYTPRAIIDGYGQMNITDYPPITNITSIKYIPDDDSLIVLNFTFIGKLSAKNESIVFRTLSTSNYAVSILHNDSRIYIAFATNRSINMFDLNLTLLQTSISWSTQAGYFGGMFLWNNKILIVDVISSKIWSIDSLNQQMLTSFFDFSLYNISFPLSLFIYQNETLYISSKSRDLHVFNLSNFQLKQIITLSLDVSMLFMRYDSNCNRLWFGTQNYTYAPVLDLQSSQMNIYQTKGILSKYGIYSIDFDINYKAFYTDTNGYLRQIYLPDIYC